MNIHQQKIQKQKSEAVANHISQQQPTNNTLQFVDNRPEARIQQKLVNSQAYIKSSENANAITQLQAINVIQLGKKRKRKDRDDDSDDEYLPPYKRRKHRQTFSKSLRNKVIKKAPKNKSGLHVCPGCGMPLATAKGKEIKTYYTSKSGKRHNIVSGQLDHYPPWNKRLSKLKKQKKSDDEIRADHDDPTRLRPLCRRCNQSHKFENTDDLPEDGFSDEEYYSDDEARDNEIWKPLRKHDDDDDSGAGAGAGITA